MITSYSSEKRDPFEAGCEIGEALSDSDFTLLFANYNYDLRKLLGGFRSRSNSTVTGCSSSYSLCDGNLVEYGVSAIGTNSKNLVSGSAAASLSGNFHDVGVELAERALEDLGAPEKKEKLARIFARYSAIVSSVPERVLLSKPYFYGLMFLDPLTMADEEVLSGIRSRMNLSAPVSGGDSFGNVAEWRSYQILNEVYENSAVFNVVATDKSIGLGCGSGFEIVSGEPYVVTKASGRRVYEINYTRAVDIYSGITGIGIEELKKERFLAYRIGVKFPFVVVGFDGGRWMKYPVLINGDGSITFGTITNTGSVLFRAKADKEQILKSAETSIKSAIAQVDEPRALLVFDCWYRLAALGEDYGSEAKVIKNCIGSIPMAGFYTMGEILSLSGFMGHRNGSIVAVALGD